MLNSIVLIGRLTADPEVTYTPSGVARGTFTLAVDRRFRTQSGERETDFIRVVVWRKTAEVCGQYLSKGRMAAVQGRLQVRKYQTQEGETRTMTEVVGDNVEFIGGRGDRQETDPQEPSGPSETPAPEEAPRGDDLEAEDDLPF